MASAVIGWGEIVSNAALHNRYASQVSYAYLFCQALRLAQPTRERRARSMRRQCGNDLLDRIGQIEHSQTERNRDQEGIDFARGFVDPAQHESCPIAIS